MRRVLLTGMVLFAGLTALLGRLQRSPAHLTSMTSITKVSHYLFICIFIITNTKGWKLVVKEIL